MEGIPNRIKWLMVGLLCLVLWPAVTPAQRTYRTRTPEEIAGAGRGARGALGIDQRRGDRLHVATFPFPGAKLRAKAERKRKEEAFQELVTTVILNVSKGVAVVLALLVLRAITGAIGRGVAREEEIALEAQRELEAEGEGEELAETPHEILLSRISRLIVERPEDSARVIQTLLIEDRGQVQI